MSILVVTGTNTGVGKTIATAALAARAAAAGQRVVVVKPAQTGAVDGDSDAREIHRLTGVEVQEWTVLQEPLAPDTAAGLEGVQIPRVSEYAARITALAPAYDLVIVEGAGGLLVRLDAEGGTVLDIAAQTDADVVVVCAAGLGTLNHTELTVQALRARGVEPVGLIIGSMPASPGLAERLNRDDLPRVSGVPVIAEIPEGAGTVAPEEFRTSASGWFND
ncbi:ATP-dependent dethiobiotin synthetase BioD [Nocardioides baekrokdamisoli]|uniref:ATP-dependent dethiobiotin synthetase BioD n=1 Tax=Nocardioides baekrokdamisoli TaxID=1804624 RepID=A0A3G9IJ02_9ACTN|nr:dethiobiotin synthase [Nocardioides baekrokdamisoli]BBH18152.1 ATP-dependent dethiobiotin synthetase BioD [Nocardioides baekrokdamisoli]